MGTPYLNRRFFSLIGESMADDTLLIMARRKGRYVAGRSTSSAAIRCLADIGDVSKTTRFCTSRSATTKPSILP